MSPKKKTPADRAKKELKAAIAALRAELASAEKRIGKLTAKIGGLETAKAELERQVGKLTKKLDKARKTRATREATPAEPVQSAEPVEPAAPAGGPDATWTVARLRAEVTARGLTGVGTRATKAQLLAALAPRDG